ncbi:hypothetical protein [Sphingomonas sp. M1-B02]|uniref:hypothetical protein n=1 Tax=Sphingomonas sp. M1-B02 TaxID=3114300 RepID=UPI00224008B3|nr:hypothetical protein [Sphingomonas sp. S6-11]UZK66240.1 hypothetical protein OKW87_17320 [Sphingomonas sp. S6-11]
MTIPTAPKLFSGLSDFEVAAFGRHFFVRERCFDLIRDSQSIVFPPPKRAYASMQCIEPTWVFEYLPGT